MFLPQLVLSVVFILVGLIMAKYPPRKINPLYGYRTRRSMQSTDAWKYAQRISSRRMVAAGFGGLLLFFAGWALGLNEGVQAILLIASLLFIVVYVIYSVERSLAKKFPDIRN
jgi:uncharacterized membrane protein